MKIAVLFGGDSMERDVSIASASQVVGALRSRGHQVIAYDSGRGRLTAADEQRLFAGKIDREPPDQRAVASLPTVVSAPDLADVDLVFLAMHGGTRRGRHRASVARFGRDPLYGQRQARQRAWLGQRRREAAVPRGGRTHSRMADGARLCGHRGATDRLSVDREAERPGLHGRAHARRRHRPSSPPRSSSPAASIRR